MNIDLSTTGFKFAANVENVRRVTIQSQPIDGDATGAIVEVKRAFDSRSDSPRVSFSTPQLLAVDGASVLEICVENESHLHFEVTTAAADKKIDIEILTKGQMVGFTRSDLINVGYVGVRSIIAAQDSSHTFVLAEPDVANTSAIEIKHSVDPQYTPVSFAPAASLAIDGQTISEIRSDPAGFLQVDCTTAQAGQLVRLWYYIRNEAIKMGTTDFMFEVAKGNVFGHSSFIVHAHNASVSAAGTEEAWPEGGSITYMTSAETMNIVSTDADDDGDPADTGVRTIEILGLDANYNQISEIVTMNGTTNVLTTNSYLRVYELLAKTAGSSSFNEGIIRATASSAGTVQCHMEAGLGISRCTHYTVPAGKTAYMVQNEMATHKISGGATPEVEFELIVTDSAGCSKRLIDEIINTEVVERIFMPDRLPEGLAEKTDIHWVINTDTNVTEVDIRSWILLVDN